MEHFFNTLRISNFKSLKNVTLSDCKRINVLIGKPNVGKSNVLEAIGLYSLPYIKYNEGEKITQFVRLENIPELFFDGNVLQTIIIEGIDTTDYEILCFINHKEGLVEFSKYQINKADHNDQISQTISLDNSLNWKNLNISSTTNNIRLPQPPKVKYYKFHQPFIFKKQKFFIPYLLPPYGTNLFDVIQGHKELKADLSKLFSEYGQKLLFDNATYALRLMKTLDEDNIISFPYSSIADTLQRIIFFKAAISSNKDSIILFEEPEAHCFPPYITHIAREIIDSETNQFFIATHSPYILDTFLEKDRNDLAIYMTDFKEGQTVIKRLTDAELNEVYEYGLDLFFNAELFTDEI
jgi:AAA15 family ATPase/GTPase